MRNENFAERLFCDLRNAGIELAKPHYQMDGHKIGELGITNQLAIYGTAEGYTFSEGPAFAIGDSTFTDAYQQMLNRLTDLAKPTNKLKFVNMVVPRKGVEKGELEEFMQVISRYVKDWLPQSDIMGERWDVLVGPAE